jgi:hypothetical protein
MEILKQTLCLIEATEGLDFKLSPCFECRMFAFGLFPGVCSLHANISEHSVCSIFIGEYVRSDSGGEI